MVTYMPDVLEQHIQQIAVTEAEAEAALHVFASLDDDLHAAAEEWAQTGVLPDTPRICGHTPHSLQVIFPDVTEVFFSLQQFRDNRHAEEIGLALFSVVKNRKDLRFRIPQYTHNQDASPAERDFVAIRVCPKDNNEKQYRRVRTLVDDIADTCDPAIWRACVAWASHRRWPVSPDIRGATPAYLGRLFPDNPERVLAGLCQLGQDPDLGIVALQQYIAHAQIYGRSGVRAADEL